MIHVPSAVGMFLLCRHKLGICLSCTRKSLDFHIKQYIRSLQGAIILDQLPATYYRFVNEITLYGIER